MTPGTWRRAAPLKPSDFPAGTPLHNFCAWNQAARRPDRRYVIAGDIQTLLRICNVFNVPVATNSVTTGASIGSQLLTKLRETG